jgi:hypothetical protein
LPVAAADQIAVLGPPSTGLVEIATDELVAEREDLHR